MATLEVRDLRVEYPTASGVLPALSGISLTLAKGRIQAVVGESGSGKSTLAAAILGLLPASASAAGSISLDGTELLGASPATLRGIRGRRIGYVGQDPYAGFDPLKPVLSQVAEAARTLPGTSRRDASSRALRSLEDAGLRLSRDGMHPHELSGGMLQRAQVAAAIVNHPDLLVADEPTSALDPASQAVLLELLSGLRDRLGLSVLVTTHDLGVVSRLADDVRVLYAGRVAETGPAAVVLARPRHPYTAALLAALPSAATNGRLAAIPGDPPDLTRPIPGCAFAPRCLRARDDCRADRPPERDVGAGVRIACFHPASEGDDE